MIKYLFDHLNSENTVYAYVRWEIEKGGRPMKISDFIDKLMTAGRNLQQAHNIIMICGFRVIPNNKRSHDGYESDKSVSSRRVRIQDGYESDKSTRAKSDKTVSFKDPTQGFTKPPMCNGCGRHHNGECRMITHPNFNNSGLPWHESESGKAYFARGHTMLPYEPPYLKPTDV